MSFVGQRQWRPCALLHTVTICTIYTSLSLESLILMACILIDTKGWSKVMYCPLRTFPCQGVVVMQAIHGAFCYWGGPFGLYNSRDWLAAIETLHLMTLCDFPKVEVWCREHVCTNSCLVHFVPVVALFCYSSEVNYTGLVCVHGAWRTAKKKKRSMCASLPCHQPHACMWKTLSAIVPGA